MTLTRIFAAGWVIWIVLGASLEAAAFALRRTDLTLSEFTWRLEGPGWTAGRYLLVAGLVFLLLHLAFGWLRLAAAT